MAGEAEEQNAQALWNEVAKEREDGTAADPAPVTEAAKPEGEQTDAAPAAAEGEGAKPTQEATPTEPDPYEGLSPAIRARLERLDAHEAQLAQLPQLVQTVKTAEGRVAAMQRELDQAKAAAKATGTAPTQAQIAAAAGSLEKWDSLKNDFPEWADATEQFVKASLAGMKLPQGLDQQTVDQLVEQRTAAVRAEMQRAIEEAKVEAKHPNWVADIQSDDFKKWREAQPPEVQNLAMSDKSRDAIRMLDLFAEAKARPVEKVQQERANRLAAAASNKPSAGVVVPGKSPEDMTPAELWEYERKRKKGAERGLTY